MPGPPQSVQRRKVAARPWVVLLVDDEPDVLTTMADLLERSLDGVKVLRARSGREGLETLERERVDAIISDFKMMGMDGVEFLYLARKVRPHIPRAMFTAFADEELARRAKRDGGVTGFLSKAASPEQFVAQVAALLTYEPAIVAGP